MDYYFKDFLFKSDQLILFKQKKSIKLRSNEAKLLALLLSDPQQVFSKDKILENVWAGKSVAEQSIFQNISNLRTILGDDAIITHPKRGYQWQLKLKDPRKEQSDHETNKPKKTLTRAGVLLVFTVCITIIMAFLTLPPSTETLPTIAVTPSLIDKRILGKERTHTEESSQYSQKLVKTLNTQNNFKALFAHNGKSFYELKASPELLVFAEKERHKAGLILSTRIKKRQNKFYITFNLISDNNKWTGTLSAESFESMTIKLAKHIHILISANYFQTHKDNLRELHAKLQLMHSNTPDDLVILAQYIQATMQIGALNEALLLAEQLKESATKVNSDQYLAIAYSIIGEIFYQQQENDEAHHYFEKAARLLKTINDIDKLAYVARLQASLYLDVQNYNDLKTVLLDSIKMLEGETAYFSQLEQLITLAVFANKLKKFNERDSFLSEAKRLIDIHNFPKEHYSAIYFQQGLFAEQAGDNIEAERYYRWVLNLFSAEQNSWYKERAQFHLSLLLIQRDQVAQAIKIFENEDKLTAKEKIILATIYRDDNNLKESVLLAKQAYREAVLSGELIASLNAALMLVELSHLDKKLSNKTYLSYLKKQATPNWKSYTKSRLIKLDLYPL